MEAVEMTEPDQHLIGVAAGGLEQRAGAAFPVLRRHGAEEQTFHAMAVPQLPEQAARHNLRPTGLKVWMVMAEDEEAHGSER